MAEEPKIESPIASLGGKARAAKMTPAERKESARKAAEARWGSDLPRAEFAGELDLAGQKIACAVLEDGRRVLSQQSFIEAIGRTGQLKVAARSAEGDFFKTPVFLAAGNLISPLKKPVFSVIWDRFRRVARRPFTSPLGRTTGGPSGPERSAATRGARKRPRRPLGAHAACPHRTRTA